MKIIPKIKSTTKVISTATCLTALISFLAAVPAQAEKFMIRNELGWQRLEIKDNYVFDEFSRDDDGFSILLAGGVKFESALVATIFYSDYDFPLFGDLFDRYRLSEKGATLGYSFSPLAKLNVIPQLGYTHWRLRADEGVFLDSGAQLSSEDKGNNLFGKIDFEIPFSDHFAMYYSFTLGDYDFGTTYANRLGLAFTF